MDEVREAVEFLARSGNRVETLFQLQSGRTSRSDLRSATGMSQVTIGRVLSDLEERRWIATVGGDYQLTAVGRLVTDALEELIDAVSAASILGDLAPMMPTETYDFELERLASATVIRPEPIDPNVTLRTAARQVAESDHVRILTQAFSAMVIEVLYDRVLAEEMTAECVFSSPVFEALDATREVSEQLVELVAADGASFHSYEGDIPHIYAVLDDGVGMGIADEEGVPRAILDVSDPVVREWAIETFERYRDEATLVDDPEVFDPDASPPA